jgi:hypothetical protein
MTTVLVILAVWVAVSVICGFIFGKAIKYALGKDE